jgi:CheY-like chemotaxis protein
MSDKILVVDDDPAVLGILTKILANEGGYQVFQASNAREALQIWNDNDRPGMVLTDLKLGGDMDGVSLCSRICYEAPRTVVMAITGLADEYQLAYCRGVGFSDVLEKPVNKDELLGAVDCASQQRARWKNIA